MYTLFVSKVKNSFEEVDERDRRGFWPLAYYLHEYIERMANSEFPVNCVVASPGYLSEGQYTTIDFLITLDQMLSGVGPDSKIDFMITRGMNGNEPVVPKSEVTKQIGEWFGDDIPSVLRRHANDHRLLFEHGYIQNFTFSTLKPSALGASKNCRASAESPFDHRKALFLLHRSKTESLCGSITKSAYESWLQGVKAVTAMVVGSSNMSSTTYFSRSFKKGEADVMMFEASEEAKKFALKIQNEITSITDASNEIENSLSGHLAGQIAISKSMAFSPPRASILFKQQMDQMLRYLLCLEVD